MSESLLITKADNWSDLAADIAKAMIPDIRRIRVEPNERMPDDLEWESGKTLVSFLCPWVLPAPTLRRFDTAINFHPASTDYPGIGCYNFALYDGAKQFGAVCHHMSLPVDSGPVIMERRFPVFDHDGVASLKERTMATMLGMFTEVIGLLASGRELPAANTKWTRKAFTRKELNALCEVTIDMHPSEIARRVRAVKFDGYPGAKLTLGGVEFRA